MVSIVFLVLRYFIRYQLGMSSAFNYWVPFTMIVGRLCVGGDHLSVTRSRPRLTLAAGMLLYHKALIGLFRGPPFCFFATAITVTFVITLVAVSGSVV